MASASSNSANALARYRPAILAVTAIAAGCTLYYIHNIVSNSASTSSQTVPQQNTLHRSNAQRRSRQSRVTDAQVSESNRVQSDSSGPRPLVSGAFDVQDNSRQPQSESNGGESGVLAALEATIPENRGGETVVDAESERSWRGDADADEVNKEGQSLLNLLYRIAEEQARKDGYVHRGVTCNSCNAMPIRGIRYRCANCIDFDLCEQCEALQVHPKTHLFYKVRVPAPFLGNPRQPQPVWYPGKPAAVVHNLPIDVLRKFCTETGFQIPEIEALWEQFRCLAATEWLEDPNHYHLAIDRQTFDRCFVPSTSIRPPPSNLIYDRLFAFYDTNCDGLIGFDEFLKGLASFTKKNIDERRKRIFHGYDINQDGYVDRKDFLRMFRANYALTKELLREVISSMDDEMFDWSGGARDIIVSSQPISSAFSGAIQQGEQSRTGEGKVKDENGDLVISDNMGAIRDEGTETGDHNETLADKAESATFGDVEENITKDLEVCRSILNEDMSDTAWPPDFLIFDDGYKALDWFEAYSWHEVANPVDRRKVLLQALRRLESFQATQQTVRQEAIYERWRRRQFFLEDENGVVPPDGFERQERNSPPNGKRHTNDPSSARATVLHDILKSDVGEAFHNSIVVELQDLKSTPSETYDSASEYSQKILDMVCRGCTGDMVAEAITDFVPSFSVAIKFALWLFDHIKDWEGRVDKGVTVESPFGPMVSSRRSRSSSKVRFQDDVATEDEHETRSATSMSSRSIPIGERWGGYEIPEAEKDVGREVLYQVTQEAFNELLDPIFKVREELAIKAFRTRDERKIFRERLDAYKTERMKDRVKSFVDRFQEVWYTTSSDELMNDHVSEKDMILGFRIKANGEVQDIQQLLEEEYKRRDQARRDFGRTRPNNGKDIFERLRIERERAEAEHIRTMDESKERVNENPQEDNEPEQNSATPVVIHTTTYDPDEPPASNEPEVVLDLHEAVTAFNDADPAIEDSISQKPLDELLAQSGYAPISSIPSSPNPLPLTNQPDPTLPQNRPNRPSSPSPFSHQNASPKTSPPYPSSDRLKHLAAMDYVEEEDEKRGGPGRISFEEFEMLMKGPKGPGLGFVGDWIDKASF